MKIYEIGTGYTPIPAQMGAATEIVVEELTRALRNNGHDAIIVDIKTEKRKKIDLPIIEVSVPKKYTGTDVSLGIAHKLKRVVYSINLALTLKKLLKNNMERVVLHFHNQYNMFFFLKLVPEKIRKNCFIAYTNHSYIWHGEWPEIKTVIQKRYFQEVYCMKHADCVYALNKKTVETLIKYIGIPDKKIVLIDNGVNTEVYQPLDEKEKKVFREAQGKEAQTIFIQIGSVCERKNQLDSIRLLLPLLKENRSITYFYAGGIIDEEYQRVIEEYVKKNEIDEQVHYLGELRPGDELNKYYNLADAMIFPSKSEGFSLVIIEAMAAGVPVIINKKLQFKLSETCLRFSDKEDFRKIVETQILNKNEQRNLSEKSRNIVVEQYSWDKIARDYFETWEK